MSMYICCFFPKKTAIEKNGAVPLAIAIDATTQNLAVAKAVLRFEEDYPNCSEQYSRPKLCPDKPGLNRPALNEFDETYFNFNSWNEEKKSVEPIPPDDIVEPENERVIKFSNLSPEVRIAHLVLHGKTDIDQHEFSMVLDLQNDDSGLFESHIVEGLAKIPAVAHMYPEKVLELIAAVREHFEPGNTWPAIKKFAERWVQYPANRPEQPTQSIALAETLTVTDRGENYHHDMSTLNLEIALGIIGRSQNFDIYNLQTSTVNRAREIVQLKEKPFPAWSTALCKSPCILDYSRASIIALIKTAPENIWNTPGALQGYINRTLTETNHANPTPKIVDMACGCLQTEEEKRDGAEPNPQNKEHLLADATLPTGPVEQNSAEQDGSATSVETQSSVADRSGPFYYRNSDGQVGRANKLAKFKTAIEQGCEEITKEEYQARKDMPPLHQQTISGQPEINNLGNGRFAIDGLDGNSLQPGKQIASNEVEKTEVVPTQSEAPSFQSIGAALENDLAGKGDNMKIWRSVMRTDPRYTKDLAGAGFEGTSINAEYMFMRATEIFGPIGTGWGFEVLEDRMIPGAPMSEAIYEDKKFICNRILRDSDGSLITELNHSIKISFWYLSHTGTAERFEAYGATPYMYKTKSGIRCDGEAQKKSLTDAIKKALSLLGFSADVWLGLYDQAEYKQENAIEFDIRNASDKAEDVTRIRKELDEKFKLNTDSMRSAVTPNEVSGIASSLTRVMGVHLKAAREKGDQEYSKYLEGRLRRLEEVKLECLAKLQEKAA